MLPAVTRPEPPMTGDERPMLTVWLDYQRATLLWKCEGLDGAALVRHGVPPSSLTLLGLVRHMALVEWWWFDHVFTGSPSPEPFSAQEDPDADFNDLDPARAMADIELFRASATAHGRSPPPRRASTPWRRRPRSLPCPCAGSWST